MSVISNHHSRRALLVVSGQTMRRLCREALGSEGFVVSEVESAAAAVTAAREQRPELIILSRQLSDVPASEAVKWLRSNLETVTTPIIILGGKIEAKEASVREGTTVLSRPISAAQIHHALSEALDSPRAARGHQ